MGCCRHGCGIGKVAVSVHEKETGLRKAALMTEEVGIPWPPLWPEAGAGLGDSPTTYFCSSQPPSTSSSRERFIQAPEAPFSLFGSTEYGG